MLQYSLFRRRFVLTHRLTNGVVGNFDLLPYVVVFLSSDFMSLVYFLWNF